MEFWVTVLQAALPFFYAALVYIFGFIFFRPGEAEKQVARVLPLVYVTALLHAVYIGLFTLDNGRCLLGSFPEISSLITFTLLLIFAFAEVRTKNEASGTGFLVVSIAFLFQLFSSLRVTGEVSGSLAILKDPIFNVHVTTAIFGYSAWTLATVYGALYLMLYKSMKRNRFGAIFEHLPNLERLEKYGMRSTASGFVFLSISIVFGWLLLSNSLEGQSVFGVIFHPKILATVLAWLVFGLTLIARRVAKVEGKRLVIFWMSGFVLTVISMGFISAFGSRL